jgi:hypothetical protein
MLTLKFAAAPLATAMLCRETVQVAPKGTPEHVEASVPLKPVPGVAVKLYCAVCPAVTDAVVVWPLAEAILAAAVAVPLIVNT